MNKHKYKTLTLKNKLKAIIYSRNFYWYFIGAGLILFALSSSVRTITISSFGEYQTLSDIHDRYTHCKGNAPDKMDCVMIPMLVSEEYMEELKRNGG